MTRPPQPDDPDPISNWTPLSRSVSVCPDSCDSEVLAPDSDPSRPSSLIFGNQQEYYLRHPSQALEPGPCAFTMDEDARRRRLETYYRSTKWFVDAEVQTQAAPTYVDSGTQTKDTDTPGTPPPPSGLRKVDTNSSVAVTDGQVDASRHSGSNVTTPQPSRSRKRRAPTTGKENCPGASSDGHDSHHSAKKVKISITLE